MAKALDEGVRKLNQPALAEHLPRFVQRLQRLYKPIMIVLFGSRARGDHLLESDVDLVLVARKFEGVPFFDRLGRLLELWEGPYTLEPFAYTPAEFESMFNSHHLTALDCVDNGVELTGSREFARYRARLETLKRQRVLSKDSRGWWRLPQPRAK